MAFSASKVHFDSPRGSTQEAASALSNAEVVFALNRAYTSAAIATATTTSKVKTVATLAFTINGAFFSLAATDNFWTLSGTTFPAGYFQKYALLVDASGTASVQEATANNVSLATVTWPNVSKVTDWAPFLTLTAGGTKVVAGVLSIANVTNPFIPGTTLLGAAGVTATYVNGIDPSLLPLIGSQTGAVAGI